MEDNCFYPSNASTIRGMWEESRLKGINLKASYSNIPVFVTPLSDLHKLISKHKWEVETESLLVNESFRFAPTREVYELIYNDCSGEAFSLRVARKLQYDMKANPNNSFKKHVLTLFSSLVKEISLTREELDDILGCLCSNWYYRERLARVSSGLYEAIWEESRRRNK